MLVGFALPLLASSFFFLMLPRPPTSTLFPYTTLFRSARRRRAEDAAGRHRRPVQRLGGGLGHDHVGGDAGAAAGARRFRFHSEVPRGGLGIRRDQRMTGRLEGKTALVTGGGRGIGQAIALRFAREGARVAIVGPHKETLADAVSKGRGIEAIVGDGTKKQDVDRALDAFIGKFQRIDILVNNAGGIDPKPFFDKSSG